jgi:ribosome-associated protein
MRITPELTIEENEIKEEFVLGTGPGGQNINKVASGVQLRFDVAGSPSLPEEVRKRLIALAGKRINSSGELIIESKAYRNQRRNREEARQRLVELIKQATRKPKARLHTRPTRKSRERRLAEKRQRGEIKKMRRKFIGSELDRF